MSGMVEGKVALVTAAGSGIGRASAWAFAREGAVVAVSDIDAEGGEETVSLVRAAGGEAEFLRCDVSRHDEVEALIHQVVARWGRLDCAHNNAGITTAGGPLHRIPLDEWDRTLAVNLSGIFYCMRHEIPQMLEQGGGAILNTSSGAGLVAAPFVGHYCATKHGILGLTKTAAVENAKTGVRINALCPGSTDTPTLRRSMERSPAMEKVILGSTARGTLGTPEEVAEAAVWLCSDRASLVNGESLVIDGGGIAR